MNYFNEHGRRVTSATDRVFGKDPSFYYRIEQPVIDFAQILKRTQNLGLAPMNMTSDVFEKEADSVLNIIKFSPEFANLLEGVHIPFVYHDDQTVDLGTDLEETLLPSVQESFKARFPEAHFKAVLQSDSKLPEHISLSEHSRYENFVQKSREGTVVGWFFPEATQEFDIKSQRQQMAGLPPLEGAEICLSGGKDICAALIGTPELLINDDFYTPILCMSAYVHSDPRLVLLIKAYGPHMEFWCMTQMLTKDTTQVSEQWTGGITVFTSI